MAFSKIPYIIVATAPSMDGYASDGAAMILGGMKETVKAGLPKAIIADTNVLKNAPMDMIKAGYGDIIGKYSALNDWKFANIVYGEFFCNYICSFKGGEYSIFVYDNEYIVFLRYYSVVVYVFGIYYSCKECNAVALYNRVLS